MEATLRVRRNTQNRNRIRGYVQDGESAERQAGIYPFRILALLLMIGILIELTAILRMPDYSSEREQAERRFLAAQAENLRLTQALETAQKQETVEQSARDYGYAYYGETIYIPVFEEESGEEAFSDETP